jgi:hypothetical protein
MGSIVMSGQYIATVYTDANCYYCDDNNISTQKKEKIRSNDAFLLLYISDSKDAS